MSAKEFLADVEGGVVPVDCHEKVLRIAFIYMGEGLWLDSGVFDVVEKLHARGLSFGEGELRFNRTLDIFYLAQLSAAIYRSTDQLEGDFPSPDDFQSFYTTHHALLHSSAWRSYYSTAFLTQRTTARFYRLPDLQDLPDSDSPLGLPRQRPPAHATKLPRWAHSVARTRRRQPSLPFATLTGLALSTLETTITRLRTAHTSVPPYSETQARFWLEYMGLGSPGRSGSAKAVSREAWEPNIFGILVAQGAYDVYAWEAKYSAQLWEASAARMEVAEPDVDGVWKSEVMWCGWPDGGVGSQAWCTGWEGEVGSEEEVEFLAAVAVEETVGVKAEVGELDFAVRSHMLLGVMRATVKRGRERDVFLEELEREMTEVVYFALIFETANTISTELSKAGQGEPSFEHGLPTPLHNNAPDSEAKELKQQLLQMAEELRALLSEPSTHLAPLGRLPYSVHPIVRPGIAESFPEIEAAVSELSLQNSFKPGASP